MEWNLKLNELMGPAARLVRSGQLAEATRAIQRTLAGGAKPPVPGARAPGASSETLRTPQQPPERRRGNGAPSFWRTAAQAVEDAVVIDRSGSGARPAGGSTAEAAAGEAPQPAPAAPPAAKTRVAAEPPGSFTRVALTLPGSVHGPREYHLYVPPGAQARTPMPLVLMLHGCTQNPVDFATGTGMNDAAAPANALVLYPAQPTSANPNGCWNWFRPEDQRRGSGEPALLVAMVRDVMARHPVDAQRVYVAGLSAGGAMAALLAREYPDVFAAVGVHSGLTAGAAHNVMGALSAMKTGAKPDAPGGLRSRQARPGRAVPLIVFHGDADPTVHARNGEQLVSAALAAATGAQAVEQVHAGQSAAGQRYVRTVYSQAAPAGAPAAGSVLAEHWVLQGAGHAWSGGRAGASHTDPRGVDATAEMLRFFLAHRRAAGN